MKPFKMYPNAMEEVLRLSKVQDAVEARAAEIAQTARDGAPYESGDYKESIRTQNIGSREGGFTEIFDRPITRVIADVDHAAVVESRTRNLGRAADAQ